MSMWYLCGNSKVACETVKANWSGD